MNDLRFALRQHLRQRVFSSTVVGTLALAVGGTAAVLSVVTTVLVRALPFASPERLVWIASVRPDNPSAPFSLPEFLDYRSRTGTLSGLAAYANWSASLAGEGVTERLQGARISADAFDVLGVPAAAGRLLEESDDRADAPRVVVLSHRLWRGRFAGASDVVGKALRINGESYVVVGVLPAEFPLPLRDLDVVTPLAADRDPLRHLRNSVNFLRLFGRLTPGTDLGQAQAELTSICRSLRQQFPVEYVRKEAVRVIPLHQVVVGDHRPALLVLLAAVVVVLATALSNLVSVALVQASARRAELSMRLVLGASRWRLARQLALEAGLLSVAGAGLGWLVAGSAVDAAVRWAPASIPRLSQVTLDVSAALFVVGVVVLVTALLAVAPLGVMAPTQAIEALRGRQRGAVGDRWSGRVRWMMVVGEITAAVVLVLATAVLLRNLVRLRDRDPGFDPEGVFQARVSLPTRYRSPADLSRFYEQLSDRLAASPGVERVGVVSVAPLSGLLATVPFAVGDRPAADHERPSANLRLISPGYLETVGTRLRQGRLFSEADRSDTPAVALVSTALADRFLAGGALGRQLWIDDNNQRPRPVEVVGVVESVRQTALDLPPDLDIYLPLMQLHPDGVALLRNNQFWMVRAGANPAAFGVTFLVHLRAVDPDAAVSGSGPMRQFVDAWLGPRRFSLALFGVFASMAVLLAVLGVYGLVSYAVGQRAPEIGLRLAVGATERDVQGLVLRQAGRLGTAGAAAGLVLAVALRPLLRRVVQDVWIDPAVAAAAAALLVAVVLMAAWVPARRAARIEPTQALKSS